MMDEWLVNDVVEVYRKKCSIERVNLVCEREILSFMGAYMPQAGKIKPPQETIGRSLWYDANHPNIKNSIYIGGVLNGCIGKTVIAFESLWNLEV